ncbi:GNAT family N-acetyltransferase [Pontibacter flavimaris]|uniref:GNAT family acetyltransferase n=1 Tax=Pontibacter flavimaris TaxID=1797110 RepID=A0A1Q5P969_9BACT|nr:GNAT family N-acetyltransferase [Pontibacter flavimaris]OKL38785.1 GNAT family acetyltransferase [Pontibacter flavimaris]
MQIKEITARETWQLRRDVMWPEQSINYVQLPEDESGQHFGLYLSGELVSVVSLFVEGERAQFRKFATLPQNQGKGYGTALLQHLILQAAAQGIKQLWCNARQEKAGFYKRFGLQETNHTFGKGGKDYVVMEGSIRLPEPAVGAAE